MVRVEVIDNVLAPSPSRIIKIEKMTEIERLFHVKFLSRDLVERFVYRPGQFVEVGVTGVGEAPISICSWREEPEVLELCIRRVGRVTNAIHRLKEGDLLWIRGPYGNGFPMEEMEGNNLLLIAGGLGVAPLRAVLQYALKKRERYGEITVFYGFKSYELMLFREEFLYLFREGDEQKLRLYLSYEDQNDEKCKRLAEERGERIVQGVVTKLFEKTETSPENTYAIICGPPIMYKFVVKELIKRNFKPWQIYLTLERRMRCGIGKCGHCIVGEGNSIKYVCKDGPVFTYWDALNTKGMI